MLIEIDQVSTVNQYEKNTDFKPYNRFRSFQHYFFSSIYIHVVLDGEKDAASSLY